LGGDSLDRLKHLRVEGQSKMESEIDACQRLIGKHRYLYAIKVNGQNGEQDPLDEVI
jgi:hypothetical protein